MKHKENILKLRAEGKSYRQIEKELGCSKGTISYHLGVGQKNKTRIKKNNRRSMLKQKLIEIKEKSICQDCKQKYPHYVMDFDHVSGEKVGNVSRMMRSHSWEEVLQEVEKCELVCSNCHRERTWQRLQKQ